MARKLRVQYLGAIYHVLNGGDRREPVFKEDEDHRRFLETFGQACHRTGWHKRVIYERRGLAEN